MKTFGNIIWFIFGGGFLTFTMFLYGALYCLTIIGIPFGLQMFKIGKLVIAPFGKSVTTDFEKHPYLNLIWGGAGAAFVYCLIAGFLTLTVIGIPFAKQCIKLARLIATPFGATVESDN